MSVVAADEKVPFSSAEGRVPAEEDMSSHLRVGESIDGDEASTFNFYLLSGITEIVGIVCIVIVVIWMSCYRGGFAWSAKKVFNYHPILMVTGLVFCYGNGAMVYRLLRRTEKRTAKLVHAALQICALLFAIVGLTAVFESHNLLKIPNMYSLHSWLGIATVVIFCLQWLFGFLAFLIPTFSDAYRAGYLIIHQFFGIGMLVLAITTCLLGITEKLFFNVKNYNAFPAEGVLANVLGLLLVLFGGLVVFITTKPEYRREPDPQAIYSPIR